MLSKSQIPSPKHQTNPKSEIRRTEASGGETLLRHNAAISVLVLWILVTLQPNEVAARRGETSHTDSHCHILEQEATEITEGEQEMSAASCTVTRCLQPICYLCGLLFRMLGSERLHRVSCFNPLNSYEFLICFGFGYSDFRFHFGCGRKPR